MMCVLEHNLGNRPTLTEPCSALELLDMLVDTRLPTRPLETYASARHQATNELNTIRFLAPAHGAGMRSYAETSLS